MGGRNISVWDDHMGVVRKFVGKQGDFDWEGVEFEEYNRGGAKGSSKRVIIGPKEGAKNFSIRYFQVEEGGQTSFDVHEHDHGIIILRGKARVLMGWEVIDVGYGDVVYISPNEEHQIENTGKGPLGFICVNPPKKLMD